MRKNKIKQMMQQGKPVINGWLQIPSTVSAEYALEMLELGFNYVSIGSDYRSISAHSKSVLNKIKN